MEIREEFNQELVVIKISKIVVSTINSRHTDYVGEYGYVSSYIAFRFEGKVVY